MSEVPNTPQRSEEWFNARRGLPTASRFDMILTPTQAKPAAAQSTLIAQLIAESILPPQEGFIRSGVMTEEMQQGMILEAQARCAFELEFATEPVTETGFILHESGLFGGSPDALLGEKSGVEIKCPKPETHISYILAGVLPNEYKNQLHGYMIVTGRESWEFFSYATHFPPFRLRVVRDEFTEKLEAELFKFCAKYNEARAKFNLPPIGKAT